MKNMVGEAQEQQLHVVFFPFLAHGHMIPIQGMARLFASRQGVKATIITTPANKPSFTKAIQNTSGEKVVGGPTIHIEVFKLPFKECGLPENCEIINEAIKLRLVPKFMKAVEMLEEQLESYLDKTRPDCLVSDMFLTWTTDCAAKFNIPRLVFHGTGYFHLCVEEIVRLYKPCNNTSSDDDDELLIIPCIPHEIKMTRLQLEEQMSEKDKNMKRMIKESELKSFGVIVNSFYELEPDYADFFTKELGRRVWHIGPVSLSNRPRDEEEEECLKWLNSKQQDSVIYISFGSIGHNIASQLHEIARALETCEHNFIWLVKNDEDKMSQEWMPPGFEQRMEGKGLIIRGWSPQKLILKHKAIGAFVTHCGWNSTLEAISNGVPMVTWPSCADQFNNEKLVTAILKIGVPIGVRKLSPVPCVENFVKRDTIEKVFREIMEGNEALGMRSRAKMLKVKAFKALQEDGSSYLNLGDLINELKNYHKA